MTAENPLPSSGEDQVQIALSPDQAVAFARLDIEMQAGFDPTVQRYDDGARSIEVGGDDTDLFHQVRVIGQIPGELL